MMESPGLTAYRQECQQLGSSTITISGTPTVAGRYIYSILLTGGCGVVNATGTINVTATNTVTAGVVTPICINTALPSITHTTTELRA